MTKVQIKSRQTKKTVIKTKKPQGQEESLQKKVEVLLPESKLTESISPEKFQDALKPFENKLFLFADTETTGLDKHHLDDIHEVAVVPYTLQLENGRCKSTLAMDAYHSLCSVSFLMDPDLQLKEAYKMIREYNDENAKSESTKLHPTRFLINAYKKFRKCYGLEYRNADGVQKKIIEVREETEGEELIPVVLYEFLKDITAHIEQDKESRKKIYNVINKIKRIAEVRYVLQLTHYYKNTKELVRSGSQRQTPEQMVAGLYKYLEQAKEHGRENKMDVVLVGQNLAFDIKFIEKFIMNKSEEFITPYMQSFKYIDTVLIARKYINKYLFTLFMHIKERWEKSHRLIAKRDQKAFEVLKKLAPFEANKLGVFTEYLNIDNDNWHNAMNDVIVTSHLLLKFIEIENRFFRYHSASPSLRTMFNEIENMKSDSAGDKYRHDFEHAIKVAKRNLSEQYSELLNEKFIATYAADYELEQKKLESKSKSDKKKCFKDYSFHGSHSIDPYRSKHISEYNAFVRKVGQAELKVKPKKTPDEIKEKVEHSEYTRKLAKEFPECVGYVELTDSWIENSLV